MIPLVVLDLDGTLIGSSGQVLDCVWETVEKLRVAGVKMAVCTGRPCGGVAQRVAQRLGPNNPHVFQSGAVVAYPDGKTLQVSALREINTKRLIEHARKLSFVLELYTPNEMFVERKTTMSEAHAKMIGINAIVRDLSDVAANEPVVRAQWVLTAEQLEQAADLQLEGAQLSTATSPALKDVYFVSVTQKGVSKGSAVRHLTDILKVKLANTMAVGDSAGDLPMLELVGHPVIMGNAEEDIKARFTHIAGNVDDCGVVPVLKKSLELKMI